MLTRTGEGPDLVGEDAQDPGALLGQRDGRRARAPFARPQDIVGRRRELEDGANSPYHRTWVRRGEKGRELSGAEAPRIVTGGGQRRLFDDRQNRARDQIPLSVQVKGDHRLDVQHVLNPVVRSDAAVHVVLQRNADEVGDRILCLLGQLGFIFRSQAEEPMASTSSTSTVIFRTIMILSPFSRFIHDCSPSGHRL